MVDDENDGRLGRRAFLRAAMSAAVGAGALGWVPEAMARGTFPTSRSAGIADPYRMLVLGDSIMWGQGLDAPSKFSTRVASWIEARLERPVEKRVFAHSGAHIKANPAEDAKPSSHGEVPDDFPSITAQVAQSRQALSRDGISAEQVDLILLDGGINDVKVTTILTTDPTVTDKIAWIRKLTRERVGDRMVELLALALTTYPNALVVVTSYYPIVSRQTDLTLLRGYLERLGVVGDVAADLISSAVRGQLTGQCNAFHDESVKGLRRAVESARPAIAATGTVKRGVPAGPGPLSASVVRRRAAFAQIAFGERNAYGAPDTYLFTVGEQDPARTERETACRAAGQGNSETCKGASMGHPNARGARAYADAITAALQTLDPKFREDQPVTEGVAPAVRRGVRMPSRP